MTYFAFPPPIPAFIEALNDGDSARFMATFADDAHVNDQFLNYWGNEQILDWARRDVFKDRLKVKVVSQVTHYGNFILTADVDGDFDKRGLPEPLRFDFHIMTKNTKIVQLIILRNHAGT